MTNFRALLQELTDAVLPDDSHVDCAEIARRARAALAEPEPPADCPGCEGVPAPGNQPCAVCGKQASPPSPVDGEVAELVNHLLKVAAEDESDGCTYDSAFTRRAADLLSRLAPQPVPDVPTDEHILRLARE